MSSLKISLAIIIPFQKYLTSQSAIINQSFELHYYFPAQCLYLLPTQPLDKLSRIWNFVSIINLLPPLIRYRASDINQPCRYKLILDCTLYQGIQVLTHSNIISTITKQKMSRKYHFVSGIKISNVDLVILCHQESFKNPSGKFKHIVHNKTRLYYHKQP